MNFRDFFEGQPMDSRDVKKQDFFQKQPMSFRNSKNQDFFGQTEEPEEEAMYEKQSEDESGSHEAGYAEDGSQNYKSSNIDSGDALNYEVLIKKARQMDANAKLLLATKKQERSFFQGILSEKKKTLEKMNQEYEMWTQKLNEQANKEEEMNQKKVNLAKVVKAADENIQKQDDKIGAYEVLKDALCESHGHQKQTFNKLKTAIKSFNEQKVAEYANLKNKVEETVSRGKSKLSGINNRMTEANEIQISIEETSRKINQLVEGCKKIEAAAQVNKQECNEKREVLGKINILLTSLKEKAIHLNERVDSWNLEVNQKLDKFEGVLNGLPMPKQVLSKFITDKQHSLAKIEEDNNALNSQIVAKKQSNQELKQQIEAEMKILSSKKEDFAAKKAANEALAIKVKAQREENDKKESNIPAMVNLAEICKSNYLGNIQFKEDQLRELTKSKQNFEEELKILREKLDDCAKTRKNLQESLDKAKLAADNAKLAADQAKIAVEQAVIDSRKESKKTNPQKKVSEDTKPSLSSASRTTRRVIKPVTTEDDVYAFDLFDDEPTPKKQSRRQPKSTKPKSKRKARPSFFEWYD